MTERGNGGAGGVGSRTSSIITDATDELNRVKGLVALMQMSVEGFDDPYAASAVDDGCYYIFDTLARAQSLLEQAKQVAA